MIPLQTISTFATGKHSISIVYQWNTYSFWQVNVIIMPCSLGCSTSLTGQEFLTCFVCAFCKLLLRMLWQSLKSLMEWYIMYLRIKLKNAWTAACPWYAKGVQYFVLCCPWVMHWYIGHTGILVMGDNIICMSSGDGHPIKTYCCVGMVITVESDGRTACWVESLQAVVFSQSSCCRVITTAFEYEQYKCSNWSLYSCMYLINHCGNQ